MNKQSLMPKIIIILGIAAFIIGGIFIYRNQNKTTTDNGKTTQVTVAQFGDFFLYMPLYIAKDKGFFKQQGLDVNITNTGGDDKTYAAVISGDAQFGIADPTFVAIAGSKGQKGRVVASVVNGVPFWGVTKKNILEIKNPSMLKGYSVVTFPKPSTAYVLQEKMFKDGNLEPNIIQTAPGSLLTQLESGQVDIALELEPNVSTATQKGAKILYSMPEMYGDFAITGVSVSEDYIQKNPEQVQKFVNALQMALDFARNNKDEAAEIALKRFPSLDKEVAVSAFNRMLETNILPKTTVISIDAWDKATNLRIDSGDLQSTVEDARKVLDNSFAEKSKTTIKN